LVLDFMENGSLRSYLDQNFNSIIWQRRLNIMFNISMGLYHIHNFNLIHKDLHLGNVLLSLIGDSCNACISDSGFCKPADEDSLNSDNYGVMPYMAPEILRGKKYTKASDIYSFGIIMNEIISIIPSFNNEPHDRNLASDICHGKCLRIREEVPEFLKELIQKCWDANPENRPTSKEIVDKLCYY
ncbi:kinase-like domain-containing protein, partial [Glomus cerebriforme]